ncbi:hypothetical protein F4774DRAFT_368400 [Daldinia eschscholtzii]|nr:hypothetical protein F4774DRAFT_368400 [Daldinia eschscholtzii]
MKQLLAYSARFVAVRRTPLFFRTYVTSPKAQSTQGQASPGTASNVTPGNASPSSASSDEQRVKTKRATGGASLPDSASVAEPVSDPAASGIGRQEEEHGGAAQALKQDPKKPDEEKRKAVEDMGNRPLDKYDQ